MVILGLMGVGKTTTAAALAKALACPLSDSDAEIADLAGAAGVEVAERLGVPALHQLERAVLIAALARSRRHVIASAASVVEDETVRQLLARPVVVVIDAELSVVHERQATGDHRRPMSQDELQTLARRRAPLFDQVADLRIDGAQSTDDMVAAIIAYLDSMPSENSRN